MKPLVHGLSIALCLFVALLGLAESPMLCREGDCSILCDQADFHVEPFPLEDLAVADGQVFGVCLYDHCVYCCSLSGRDGWVKASGPEVYAITVYEGTVFAVDGCWCIVRQQLKAMSVDSCWVPASSRSGTVRAQAVAMANGVAYIVGEDNKVY